MLNIFSFILNFSFFFLLNLFRSHRFVRLLPLLFSNLTFNNHNQCHLQKIQPNFCACFIEIMILTFKADFLLLIIFSRALPLHELKHWRNLPNLFMVENLHLRKRMEQSSGLIQVNNSVISFFVVVVKNIIKNLSHNPMDYFLVRETPKQTNENNWSNWSRTRHFSHFWQILQVRVKFHHNFDYNCTEDHLQANANDLCSIE